MTCEGATASGRGAQLAASILATVLGLSGLRLLNVPGTTTAIVVVLAIGMIIVLGYIAWQIWTQQQERHAPTPLAPEFQ